MQTNIIVKLQVDAVHNWPGVVEFPELKDVNFLQYVHRHMFHICGKRAVHHDDRDLEIIEFKRDILDYLEEKYGKCNTKEVYGHDYVMTFPARTRYLDFGSKSCEMLARELLEKFDMEYCEVLEDGENGAEIYR